MLVKAAGGKVVPGVQREVGWQTPQQTPYTVHLTDAGQEDSLFTGLADTIPVFQLHGEMVEVTPEMTVLATGDVCPVQAVRWEITLMVYNAILNYMISCTKTG